MKKTTIKAFEANCNEPTAAIVRPVVNQMGLHWEDAQNYLRDCAEHGAASGFCGFIYYRETVKFWLRNRKKINSLINYYVDEFGDTGAVEFVQNFNCIKGDFTIDEIGRALYGNYNDNLIQIYNALAWFALEEVANAFVNFEYDQENN